MTDLIPGTARSGGPGRGPRGRVEQLRRLVAEQPTLGLAPLRLFLGVTFAFAGLQKLADPSFLDASDPRSLQGQLALVRDASPLRFMLGTMADHAVLLGVVIALTELAVGVATLLGLWARLAAAVGALLALSFFLTISWRTTPYYYGSDIGFALAWTPFVILGAPVLSLDAWRRGRRQLPVTGAPATPADRPLDAIDQDRRAVLATGAVGAAVLAVAGLDAGVGRALRPDRSRLTAAPPTTAPPTAVPSGGSSPPATSPVPSATGGSSPAPAGTRIGAASALPVGGALRFTDPASGNPAYAVQPRQGQYRAYSAVCSHAGCTVDYATSARQFRCPCHGGVFDGASGQVLAGPPPAPLQRIEVRASGGQLIVPDGA
ncbi:MAG: Rieske 2Fe-2S domain-containing protein [Frankiaceae bacterium]